MTPSTVAVVGHSDRCQVLACDLNLPRYDTLGDTGAHRLALLRVNGRTVLQTLGDDAPGPVCVNWLDPAIERRIRGGRKQPLGRAVGLHRQKHADILDATAGLGRDGFVLAALGATVTLCERDPVLIHLLRDGYARAAARPDVAQWLPERLRLHAGDARRLMQGGSRRADVVYLDPMYPLRGKNALAKKEMRLLRTLVGDDDDAGTLLQAALDFAHKRVVVKRPPKAPPLASHAPDLTCRGKQARYDVYLIT